MDANAQAGTLAGQGNGFSKSRARGQQGRTREDALFMGMDDSGIHFFVDAEIIGIDNHSIHSLSPQKIKIFEIQLSYFSQGCRTEPVLHLADCLGYAQIGPLGKGHAITGPQVIHTDDEGFPGQYGRSCHSRIAFTLWYLDDAVRLFESTQLRQNILFFTELIDYYTWTFVF